MPKKLFGWKFPLALFFLTLALFPQNALAFTPLH